VGTRCSIRKVNDMYYAYRFYVGLTYNYEEENRDSLRKTFLTDGLVWKPNCPLCSSNWEYRL